MTGLHYIATSTNSVFAICKDRICGSLY